MKIIDKQVTVIQVIRLFQLGAKKCATMAIAILILSMVNYPLHAQTEPLQSSQISTGMLESVEEKTATKKPLVDAETKLKPTQNKALNNASQQPILRLEDTIRGNKEQPQVLTIVPWQLPVHQRISDGTQWQLNTSPLPVLERNAFLRNLAVVKELNAAAAVTKNSIEK